MSVRGNGEIKILKYLKQIKKEGARILIMRLSMD